MLDFCKDNTFCISLLARPDRYEAVRECASVLGLEVTRWIATTPDEIGDTPFQKGGIKEAEKACAMSHVRVWKHLVANNLPFALILEDDARFDKEMFTKLREADALPADWDALFLNSIGPGAHPTPAFAWRRASYQYMTGGYILSQTGARFLLERFGDCLDVADSMTVCMQERGKSYAYFPWLIIQGHGDSTIQTKEHVQSIDALARTQLAEVGYGFDNYIYSERHHTDTKDTSSDSMTSPWA